jgi:hypothetical protein
VVLIGLDTGRANQDFVLTFRISATRKCHKFGESLGGNWEPMEEEEGGSFCGRDLDGVAVLGTFEGNIHMRPRVRK